MIEITTFGYVVLPIVLFLLFINPIWLVVLTFILLPFQASSVINLSLVGGYSLGIQPAYFSSLLFIFKILIHSLYSGKYRFNAEINYVYTPLFIFVCYAIIMGMIIPNLFAGYIEVFPPRSGISATTLTSLKFSGTNITQILYVVFLSVFAYLLSNFLTKVDNMDLLHNAILVSFVFAAIVGIYQVISWNLNWYFPDEIIYSNPSYSLIGKIQSIYGIKRLSGTWAEASVAGYHLSAGFVLCFYHHLYKKTFYSSFLLLLLLLSLVLTTSSTALIVLFILLVYFIINLVLKKYPKGNKIGFLGLLLTVVLVTMLYYVPRELKETFYLVLNSTLFDKILTQSFYDRTFTDYESLKMAIQTFGIGAGWGSNRSSSLVINLLSNAGLWGTILFTWFLIRVYKFSHFIPKLKFYDKTHSCINSLRAAVLVLFLAGTVAIPDLTHLLLWLLIALIIGFTATKNLNKLPSQGSENILNMNCYN